MQHENAEYCESVAADPPDRSLRESLGGPHLLLLAGILLVALNLRNPLIAVSTVTGPIRSDLNIDAATAGLLTSLPVLCFGLATPVAFAVIARVGAHRAVLLCLGGVAVATAVRSAGGISLALSATVVLGIAITIGNVVVPVLIGQDFASAAVLVTGAYTAAFNVGSMLSAALTVPIANLIGWRLALVSWGSLQSLLLLFGSGPTPPRAPSPSANVARSRYRGGTYHVLRCGNESASGPLPLPLAAKPSATTV